MAVCKRIQIRTLYFVIFILSFTSVSTEFSFLVLEFKYTPCDFYGTKSKSKSHHVSSEDIISKSHVVNSFLENHDIIVTILHLVNKRFQEACNF